MTDNLIENDSVFQEKRRFITRIEESVQLACLTDIIAFKPGNVSRYSDHDDTSFFDFAYSSVKIREPVREWLVSLLNGGDGSKLGTAVLNAIDYQKTDDEGVNTNLGIILTLYPLITSVMLLSNEITYSITSEYIRVLRNKIIAVLDQNGPQEALAIVKAINHAAPSGLGTSKDFDVKDPAIEEKLMSSETSIRDLFSISANKDTICQEYKTGYTIILEGILPALEEEIDIHGIITGIEITFLKLLSSMNDTQIVRRHGMDTAIEIRNKAQEIVEKEKYDYTSLSRLDEELNNRGINAGTTADLIVGALFLYFMKKSSDQY
ncbi:MAG: triphosphoribosyl-dephospho-CoA synthase [Candidatus Hodarchaeales archaeon]